MVTNSVPGNRVSNELHNRGVNVLLVRFNTMLSFVIPFYRRTFLTK